MNLDGLSARESFLHARDPRARLLSCAFFIAVAAFCSTPQALAACLALALALLSLAGVSLRETLPRLLLLNLFVASVGALLPGREGFFAFYGGLPDGALERLCLLALRCNAMLIAVSALAGTVESGAFGHALAHFGVPDKLTHLFLFTVGQVANVSRERERLSEAMRARGFRPRSSLRSYRWLASLAASLLARSLERAAKLSEAMRCRNFKGRFHLFDHFKMRASDWAFSFVFAAALAGLLALEFECRTR